MTRCIVLNGDYTYLNTVSWRRAILLVMKGKSEVLKYTNKCLNCAGGKQIKIPLIIKLIKVIRMIYKNKVPFSKRNVMVRDGYKCMYCGSNKHLTIDHIIPRAKGGKSSFENCATACKPCNNKKGSRLPSEAQMYLRRQAYAPTISEFLRLKMKKLGADKYLKEMGVY
ncbi:MAG: HNH endonuclease [Candidatus Thorarchaeota archaeon]